MTPSPNQKLRDFLRVLLAAFLLTSLFSPHLLLNAQGLEPAIDVILSPKYPKANQSVSIALQSFSTDLNLATIEWRQDGVLKTSGLGIKNFQTIAGNTGSVRVIEILIDTPQHGLLSKRVVIAPVSVEILEQSDSYTPPFYKGRSLPGPESAVTLIAVPTFITEDGRRLKNSEINFKWKKGGTVLGSLSGLGKNSLAVKGPRIPQEIITYSVEASAPTHKLIGVASHIISIVNPEIILYEDNPLTGINIGRAILGGYNLQKEEVTLVAYPYFFENNVFGQNVEYSWAINGKETSATGFNRNSITLRKPDQTGTSLVSLAVKNVNKIFENAKSQLQISFSEERENLRLSP